MTDLQFEDLTIVVGTVCVKALCLAAGIYLVVVEHYGWAWIPFLLAFSAGFKRSQPHEPPAQGLISERHRI